MKKRALYYIIFGLAASMAVLVYSKSLAAQQDSASSKELNEEELTKVGIVPNKNNAQEEAVTRPKVEYKARGLRDPFKPPQTKKEAEAQQTKPPEEAKPLPALVVQGLIWGGIFPQAIINNKVVRVGDLIEGVEITGINQEGVTILFDGKESKLPSPAATGQQPKKE